MPQAAEAALRARVAKAKAQVEALNQRGRGANALKRSRPYARRSMTIVQRSRRRGLLVAALRPTHHDAPRASVPGSAGADGRKSATPRWRSGWTRRRLESAVRRLGWRVYGTNQPAEQLSLEQAVLAYRSEYLVERSLGRLKGRPLSLTADVCAAR